MGCLPAARDHVHVRRVSQLVKVHRRHHVGSDGGRRQIDNLFRVPSQHGVVQSMRGRRRGIEHDRNLLEPRHAHETLHAFSGGGHAHAPGERQSV
jgi:hypothetical protein